MPSTESVTIVQVFLATLKRWLKQACEQGHLAAQSPPGSPVIISADTYDRLRTLVVTRLDATLLSSCEAGATQTGNLVSVATMYRELQRAKLTQKKDAAGQ